ncbi:ABC transporter ATP-binding protein [soil metagenome]
MPRPHSHSSSHRGSCVAAERSAGGALIEVRGLGYRYPRAQRAALAGLTFDVRAGEVFGFLGPSGAGKSTTQNILTGLLGGYDGAVRVFGDAIEAHGRDYYDRIGVAFEVPNLHLSLTGRENLEFFASLHRVPTAPPVTLLALLGLADAADDRAGTYSRGMRMRLNFCRSLLTSPELLFLDEPTTGQDPENARRIKQVVRERQAAGATVFLTTHDMAVAAELCDRVAFLVDGRIAVVDAPRTLMVRHGQRRVRVEFRSAGALDVREFDLDAIARDDAFCTLVRQGTVESIHSLDATLEDVFLAVTGRGLR